MGRRSLLYVPAQLAVASETTQFFPKLRDAKPILDFLTNDGRERRTSAYKRLYNKQGGVAEFVATNGMRVVYLSIDRVSEDQAIRIAESMELARVEEWNEAAFRDALKKILGDEFEDAT